MSRNARPLVTLALVALISAGCGSSAPSQTGTASSAGTGENKKATARDTGMKFAECMRENGVSDFPDPNTKGEFVYGVSVTPAVFKTAVGACKSPVRARERREGLPGPRQRRARHQHVSDPILKPAGWHDHPQRRDEEVRRSLGKAAEGQ